MPLATPEASVTEPPRAGDDRGVVGAVDGDGDHLLGAVRGRDRQVSVSAAPVLSAWTVGVVVVERVGPYAGRIDREACRGCRRAGPPPEVAETVDVGGIEVAGRGRVPAVPLATPQASITEPPLSPVITAASLAPLMVMLITCWVPSAVVTVMVSVSARSPC